MGALATGIQEIFATAKTTGTNVMICANDGTPDGHITMSNLASILGGLKTELVSGGHAPIDANNINSFCVIRTSVARNSSIWSNLPSNLSNDCGYLLTIPSDANTFVTQVFLCGPTDMYTRTNWGGWKPWEQVYNTSLLTNQTLLTPLASALGANIHTFKSFLDLPNPAGEIILLFKTTTTASVTFILNKYWAKTSMNICHVATNPSNYGHAFQFSKGNNSVTFYVAKEEDTTFIYAKGDSENIGANGTVFSIDMDSRVQVLLQVAQSLPADAQAFTVIQ